jgi:hypothetical protein
MFSDLFNCLVELWFITINTLYVRNFKDEEVKCVTSLCSLGVIILIMCPLPFQRKSGSFVS